MCAGYWSNRDWARESKNLSASACVGPTVGLIVYSFIDIPSSVVGDVIGLIPDLLIRGGPGRPAFDTEDHKEPWRCGSLQHSINTVGAL